MELKYNKVTITVIPVCDDCGAMPPAGMPSTVTAAETMPAPPMMAEAMFNGPVARAARGWLTDHLVSKYGVDRMKAEAAVAQFGDGTLLKMILDNLPQLLQFILAIIAALG